MLILLGFSEECLHLLNILLIVYLIKGCKFSVEYKKLVYAGILLLFSLWMYERFTTTGITLILNIIISASVFIMTVRMGIRSKIAYFFLGAFIEDFLFIIIDLVINQFEKIDRFFNFSDVLNVMIIFCILATIACLKFHMKKTKELVNTNICIHIYLSIGLLLGTLILVGIEMFGKNISYRLYVALLILAVLTPVINVLMYIFCIKKHVESAVYKTNAKSMEISLKQQEKFYKEMVGSYEDLRRFRHDVSSYYNAIDVLIEDKKYEELHVLTSNLKEVISVNVLYNCSNIYISATINQFMNIMRKQDIAFTFQYDVFEEITVKNMHLCSLFYNLLSNAVDATMKCDQNRTIQIHIKTKNQGLIIKIINSVDETFTLDTLVVGKTSKDDNENHGFGLFNIENIVHAYNGDVSYEIKDNKLQVVLILLDAIKID